MTEDDGSAGGRTKLERVADEYGLDGIEAEVVRRRVEDGESLRSLEAYFNRRVLEAALEDAGQAPLDGEVNNLYRLLTSDDVTEGTRTEARRRLERDGVAVTDLEADFVSYQTVNRFLDARVGDAEPDGEADQTVEDRMERLFRLESRLSAVTTSTLEQVRTRDEFTLGDFDVFVGVTVTCSDCGTSLSPRELLANRGCEC